MNSEVVVTNVVNKLSKFMDTVTKEKMKNVLKCFMKE